MKSLTRRNFLHRSALATTALSLSARAWSQVPGANDDVRVAVVGLNGRGESHFDEFRKMKGVRVVALCDVDLRAIDKRVEAAPNAQKYQDIRKLLESKEIDAISIATANHWHSLKTVWACQAGKDVYVEKPRRHNVFEARQCVEAARKYQRIVQHGTQSRSNGGKAKFAALGRSGKYGKLLLSKGYCCKPRWSIGVKPVRSRKQGELNADILEGHYSSALCHLGNISYRLASERPFEKPTDCGNNAVVGDSVMTLLENTKAIGVDPEKATLWVGPKLAFDPGKERFVDNAAADKFLTRNYRSPFVVPEKV